MAFATRPATAAALVAVVVLLACPVPARAAGVNLAWKGAANACPTYLLNYEDWADPCDNGSTAILVGSVNAPSGLTSVISEEFQISFQFDDPHVPDFWHLEASGCRPGSILVSAAFTGFSTGTTTTQCSNYWGTSASGSATWTSGQEWYNAAQLHGSYARAPGSAGPMIAGRQYYVFQAVIDDRHSAPDPSDPGAVVCAGCSIPGCVGFCWLYLGQPAGVGDVLVTTADIRRWATWQSGVGTICPGEYGRFPGCTSAPVPARRATWGQLRSLYR